MSTNHVNNMSPVSNTLLIKHFPVNLSYEDKIEFLKKCGAIDVKILASKSNKYNTAFARFPNEKIAETVLRQLHQQEVLDSRLVVEYARSKQNEFSTVQNEEKIVISPQEKPQIGTEALLQRFLDKLNSWTSEVDFRCPVPSHLRYQYPPPSHATLQNICVQLTSVPKFYTQVLHLMNKMNLPCPFFPSVTAPPPPQEIVPTENLPESETESEISTDDDRERETIPEIKRKHKQKLIKRTALIKKLVTPLALPQTKKTKFEDVFEDPKNLVDAPKTKKAKITEDKRKESQEKDSTGFGFIEPINKREENVEKPEKVSIRNEMEEERLEKEIFECITYEALAANRISEKDREVLPVFKNYTEGAPTCRLYVKNLAKNTTEEHLKYIFRLFVVADPNEPPENMFDIRLMQEGRMKGQAFVTLQTVDLAKRALANTNGYILNDKPMVVQFARSATK